VASTKLGKEGRVNQKEKRRIKTIFGKLSPQRKVRFFYF
jgi:hypothetical protein